MVGARYGWRDILMFAITAMLAWGLYHGYVTQTKYARQGKEAHDYLCYQKTVELPARIRTSIAYQTNVQLGLRKPIPGITTADIATGVARDQAALKALNSVHCE